MIEKLPKVAQEAMQQFVIIDRAFRKEYYYLSYLESDPAEWRDLDTWKKYKKEMKREGVRIRLCPTTPLKVSSRIFNDKFIFAVKRYSASISFDSFSLSSRKSSDFDVYHKKMRVFFGEICWGKAMVTYTMPHQMKKEESETLRGEREIRSSLLILDLKDGKL